MDIAAQIKNLSFGPLDKTMGPYADLATANAQVPNNDIDGHSYREGKVVLIGTGTNIKYYTWIGGYSDVNLVQFIPTVEQMNAITAVPEGDAYFGINALSSTGSGNVNADRTFVDGPIGLTGNFNQLKIDLRIGGKFYYEFCTLIAGSTNTFEVVPGIARREVTASSGVRTIDISPTIPVLPNYFIKFYSPATGGARIRATTGYGPAGSSYQFTGDQTTVSPIVSSSKVNFIGRVVGAGSVPVVEKVLAIKNELAVTTPNAATAVAAVPYVTDVKAVMAKLVNGPRLRNTTQTTAGSMLTSGVIFAEDLNVTTLGAFCKFKSGVTTGTLTFWILKPTGIAMQYQVVDKKEVSITKPAGDVNEGYNQWHVGADFAPFNVLKGQAFGVQTSQDIWIYPDNGTGQGLSAATVINIGDTITCTTISGGRPCAYIEGEYPTAGKVVAKPEFTAIEDRFSIGKWAAVQAIFEIFHILNDGQSLSIGQNGTPVLSSSDILGGLRFVGGVRPRDGGTGTNVYDSLVALKETVSGVLGETYASGIVQMIGQLLLAEDGIDITTINQQFLVSACGEGGKAAFELVPDTAYFNRLKNHITYGYARATDLGKTYGVGAFVMNLGQADIHYSTPMTQYRTNILNIYNSMKAHQAEVTGITRDVPFIQVQSVAQHYYNHLYSPHSYPALALEQVKIATELPCSIVLADWQTPFAADLLHKSATGYKWQGAYIGLVIKRWLIDGITPVMFKPTRVERVGNTLIATYPVPKGKRLVIEDAGAFSIGSTTGAHIAATNVRLIGTNKVAIDGTGVASEEKPKFRHGFLATAEPKTTRCGLRDNAGDTLVFDPSGINKPMHNYALISEDDVTT